MFSKGIKIPEKPFHFPTYLQEEIEKVRENYYPVRVSLLTRLLKKKASPEKLHPNPDDEFCSKEIGPEYGIISKYETAFCQLMGYKENRRFYTGDTFGENGFSEADRAMDPLIVQKARPDGYMILNGHHRWAAALKTGFPAVRIKIVNLTQVKDVRNMLANTRSDRRVTVDLDEVVFAAEGETALENPLPFPLNHFFRERVRKGVPALFHTICNKGYDIWVYGSGYYSMDYIRHYFGFWNVRLAGIVTGTGRKVKRDAETDHEIKKLFDSKYRSTLLIDRDLVIRIFSGGREREEYPISGSPDSWVREVSDVLAKIAKKEEKENKPSNGK